MNHQFEIYVLFLEKLIDDLESEMSSMNLKIKLLEYKNSDHPWEPKWGKIDSCPKCHIQLNQVMSYSCPFLDCPTGMGPVWCKA